MVGILNCEARLFHCHCLVVYDPPGYFLGEFDFTFSIATHDLHMLPCEAQYERPVDSPTVKG